MKHAQEFLKKLREEETVEAEEVKYIQSASDPNKKYRVIKMDGVYFCECKGFQIRGHCSHVDKILEEEKNEQRNKNTTE